MPTIVGPSRRLAPLALLLAAVLTTGPLAEEAAGPTYAGRALGEALQDLQARGLRLVYSSDVVTAGMLVGEEPPRGDPRAVLEALLAPHGLLAREGPGGTLLVVAREPARPAGAIAGTIRTRAGHRPLAAARVRVEGTGLTGTTAGDGGFLIAGLPPGRHALIVEAPGLPGQRFEGVPVAARETTRVTLDLEAAPPLLERIVVTPDRAASIDRRADSARIIGGAAIRRAAGIGDDVQRALAAQPGTVSADRSAGIGVHGGEPGEVLVLFDGLELYDPFHLRSFHGFSGIIDAAAVGGAEYFACEYPVQYGDRMGGVLDLSSATPVTPGRTFVGGSLINSRFRTEGAFREGAGHWLVSARAWYPDSVVATVDREEEGFTPSYYDLLGKIQVPVGERGILAANVLAATDEVEFIEPDGEESIDATSGSAYAWMTLKSLWSPRLYSRTLVSLGRIRSRRVGRIDEGPEFSATVSDRRAFDVARIAQDWSYGPPERWVLRWGFGATRLDAAYDYAGRSAAGDPEAIPFQSDLSLDPSGWQHGAYLSGQFRPARRLQVVLGLRWDRQTYTGESQVSPRLSLVQGLGPAGRIRASWGRYHQSQGVHELQVEDGVAEFYPAQRADQWSIGYERDLANGLTVRADAYRREMSRLRPRFENLFDPFELLPEFAPDRVRLGADRAGARGLDLSLAMDRGGPIAWYAAYSRSRAEDRIDGRGVPRSRDQPHAFQLGLNLKGGDRWSLGVAGVYHTGWPTTPVNAVAIEEPDGTTAVEAVAGPRNSERFPAYHRLDARASRHFRLGKGRLTVFAEVTNLYDRDNVCCVEDVTFEPRADGSLRAEREEGLWIQRVPSLGFAWEFDH